MVNVGKYSTHGASGIYSYNVVLDTSLASPIGFLEVFDSSVLYMSTKGQDSRYRMHFEVLGSGQDGHIMTCLIFRATYSWKVSERL